MIQVILRQEHFSIIIGTGFNIVFEYVMGIFMVAFCQMMEDVHSMKEEKKVASECKYNDNGVLKSEEERENEIISNGGWKCQIVTNSPSL